MTDQVQVEMPRYKCHKEVWALKIAQIEVDIQDGYKIYPADKGYAPFPAPPEYVQKHKPHAGGYYVVYKDGYKSFSPAEAFEDGYTPASDEAPNQETREAIDELERGEGKTHTSVDDLMSDLNAE